MAKIRKDKHVVLESRIAAELEVEKVKQLKRIADALEEGVKLLTLFRNAYIPVSDDAFSDLFTTEPSTR